MSLRLASDAPSSGPELISRQLSSLYSSSGASWLLGDASRKDLSISPPYRSYVVSLEAAAAGVLLRKPFRGWRYLVCKRQSSGAASRDEPLFAAEVSQEPGKEEFGVTHLSRSPGLQRALTRLAAIEASTTVRGRNYEVRLLEVIGLALSAWWLHEDGPEGRDLFVPLTEAMPPLVYGGLYDEERFVGFIQEMARERLQFGIDV
jgi:hypothetical protein